MAETIDLATATREQLLECIAGQADDHEMRRMTVNRLNIDNERLRAALNEILQLTGRHDLVDAWKIAERAVRLSQQQGKLVLKSSTA